MSPPCPLCGNEASFLFERAVLGKYTTPYQHCSTCDYVFVPKAHWLAEAYSEAIVESDTDIAARNIFTSLRLAALLYLAFHERGQGRFADVAGGYGLLTRLMRDLGFDFYWSDSYAKNILARGFEYSEVLGPCDAVTAIEVLEHTVDPAAFIRDNLARCKSDTLIFTTEVFPDGKPPAADKWSYYAFETGQHISFFSARGLAILGERLGLRYIRQGRLHILTRRNPSPTLVALASKRWASLPLALYAAKKLGSRRNADQRLLLQRTSAAPETSQ